MKGKVAVLTNAFQEETLIKNCVKQFKPFDLFHLVLCPNTSWNGGLKNDRTAIMASTYGANLVVEGDWKTEAQQFNYGLNLLRDYEWIIICDADERYLPRDLGHIIEMLDVCVGDVLKSNMKVYWKTKDYEITPEQTDFPTIAVRNNINFLQARATNGLNTSWTMYHMYHLSYVRSDEEMLKKITTFTHADEFDFLSWYNNIWLEVDARDEQSSSCRP